MQRGAEFLLRCQNADGGWGETRQSDVDPRYGGRGPSTVLHTAHTMSALACCGHAVDDRTLGRAAEFLLGQMTADDRWQDEQVTFTVFAGSLYYHYPLYTSVLTLEACTDYLRVTSGSCSARKRPCTEDSLGTH